MTQPVNVPVAEVRLCWKALKGAEVCQNERVHFFRTYEKSGRIRKIYTSMFCEEHQDTRFA